MVCQPDRPAGRGMQFRAPAIKAVALDLGLPLLQPAKVRDGQLQSWLADRRPDVAVVLAYGRILPPDVLRTPIHGCINLHASILPRHRGAAPIQWAILAGDSTTGISLMQMDEGMDTGPVYSVQSIPIDGDEDAGTLTERLALLAAEVVETDLSRAVGGELRPIPQDSGLVTYAPPITHADQQLSFERSAAELLRRIRALSPSPGAVTTIREKRLKILSAREATESVSGPAGTVALLKRRILVATSDGTLELLRLQLEGKPVQAAADVVNGRGVLDGDRLGTNTTVSG